MMAGRSNSVSFAIFHPALPLMDSGSEDGSFLRKAGVHPYHRSLFPPKSKAAAYNDVPHPHLLQENEAVADTVASSDFSTSLSAHVRRQLSVSWDTIAGHRRTTFLVLLRSTNTRIGGTQELSCL